MIHFLILSLGVFLLAGCSSNHHNLPDTFIDAENKTVRLHFQTGIETLNTLENRPDDTGRQLALASELNQFFSEVSAHFRLQQKNGLFRLVDSLYPADITVSFSLPQISFRQDTLAIVLSISAYERHTDSTTTFQISSFGLGSADADDHFMRFGTALADFRRRFPYPKLTRFFRPIVID